MTRAARISFAVAAGLALAAAPAVAVAVSPLSLRLDGVSMERHGSTVGVRATARWIHRGAAPIAGDTCCSGGAFDGLSVVITDLRGHELARVSHLAHQSPYSPSNPFTLTRGETRRELVFPVDGLRAGQRVRVRLEGGVIGSRRFGSGFATRWRTLRVP